MQVTATETPDAVPPCPGSEDEEHDWSGSRCLDCGAIHGIEKAGEAPWLELSLYAIWMPDEEDEEIDGCPAVEEETPEILWSYTDATSDESAEAEWATVAEAVEWGSGWAEEAAKEILYEEVLSRDPEEIVTEARVEVSGTITPYPDGVEGNPDDAAAEGVTGVATHEAEEPRCGRHRRHVWRAGRGEQSLGSRGDAGVRTTDRDRCERCGAQRVLSDAEVEPGVRVATTVIYPA